VAVVLLEIHVAGVCKHRRVLSSMPHLVQLELGASVITIIVCACGMGLFSFFVVIVLVFGFSAVFGVPVCLVACFSYKAIAVSIFVFVVGRTVSMVVFSIVFCFGVFSCCSCVVGIVADVVCGSCHCCVLVVN